MRVTLTFDNGPEPTTTPRVLNELGERDLPAVFFLVGSMLDAQGIALADAIRDAGHHVGNHSLTHQLPLGDDADRDNVQREIVEMERLLGDRNERKLFRPFGGGGHLGPHLLSAPAVDVLCEGGYTCVLWNAVPRDWENPAGWVEVGLEQCRALDHAVVVLHDLPTGAMVHLGRFLDELVDLGATFTREFPETVTPIIAGRVLDLEGLVAA